MIIEVTLLPLKIEPSINLAVLSGMMENLAHVNNSGFDQGKFKNNQEYETNSGLM